MNFLSKIIDLIYPKRCSLCGEIIPVDKAVEICDLCLALVEESRCKTIKHIGETGVKNTESVDSVVTIFPYGKVKGGMENFKFKGCKNNGNYLGDIMYIKAKEELPWLLENNQVIMFVPMYYKKERIRGYNQGQVLAQCLGKRSGLTVEENAMERVRETKKQSYLKAKERVVNIKGAFKCKDKTLVEGKKILLVDDIYTTGATTNECGKVLKRNGAKEVNVFTFCASFLER